MNVGLPKYESAINIDSSDFCHPEYNKSLEITEYRWLNIKFYDLIYLHLKYLNPWTEKSQGLNFKKAFKRKFILEKFFLSFRFMLDALFCWLKYLPFIYFVISLKRCKLFKKECVQRVSNCGFVLLYILYAISRAPNYVSPMILRNQMVCKPFAVFARP